MIGFIIIKYDFGLFILYIGQSQGLSPHPNGKKKAMVHTKWRGGGTDSNGFIFSKKTRFLSLLDQNTSRKHKNDKNTKLVEEQFEYVPPHRF